MVRFDDGFGVGYARSLHGSQGVVVNCFGLDEYDAWHELVPRAERVSCFCSG
jgi:hypothetical protein